MKNRAGTNVPVDLWALLAGREGGLQQSRTWYYATAINPDPARPLRLTSGAGLDRYQISVGSKTEYLGLRVMNSLIYPIISRLLQFTNRIYLQPFADSVLLPGLCSSHSCRWLKNAIQKCIWGILESPRLKSAHCRYSIIIGTVVVCFAQHGSSHCDYIAEEDTCHMELLLAVKASYRLVAALNA